MDWISLLLVAVFFILPLVQELLKARRGKGGDETVDAPQPIGEQLPQLPAPTPPPDPRSPRPAPTPEASKRTGGRDRKARVEEAVRELKSGPVRERISHETRANLEIAARERQRLLDPRAKVEGRQPRSPSKPVRPVARSLPVLGKHTKQPIIRSQLGTVEGLRTSIILSEVLGPPVSMREPDQKI